jgi:uridine phosphorylase
VAVDSIIDPDYKWPTSGLPLSAVSQRYLIVTDIPNQLGYPSSSSIGPNWPGLTLGAQANDIIEYVTWSGVSLTKQCWDRPTGIGSGQTVIVLNDTVNVVEGFEVFSGGGSIGFVIHIDHGNSSITIDTPLVVGLAFGANLSFRGSAWAIAFDAAANGTNVDYVTNVTSGVQYRYINGGWMKSVDGFIAPGDFRIII